MKPSAQPFEVILPKEKPIPILISSPHSGLEFPPGTEVGLDPSCVAHPEDTDWFVDRLYDFAPALGITLIRARNSRYVIDLNRDPKDSALYSDGRAETRLVPVTTFSGGKIYRDVEPTKAEIDRRLQEYYWPYYKKIESCLADLLTKHGHVLFYDAHSIRHLVPAFSKDPLPDLILGNQDGKTAAASVIDAALAGLNTGDFRVSHNHPFKGGHLTRYFGRPSEGIHALQLEMSQTIYMDEEKTQYVAQKADRVREVLKSTLLGVAKSVGELR